MKTIISIVLAFCCLPFVAVGAYEIFQNMRELNAFSRTNGTVVGNIYSLTNTDGNVAGAYHPVVEFIDDELDKYRAFSNKLSARAYSDSMRKESVEMVLIQTFPADGTALASFVSGNLIYPVPNSHKPSNIFSK